ncbi:MAG: sel1 repeat family protein, partial [Thiotrichaceae bacterium]|nr:sel1 repeat family protein [Thiotrichaceae bacterium]
KAVDRIQSIKDFQQALWREVDSDHLDAVTEIIPKSEQISRPKKVILTSKENEKRQSSGLGGCLGFTIFIIVAMFFLVIGNIPKNTGQQKSLQEGRMFYEQGNYDEALKIFRSAADQGDAEAQFLLGNMYTDDRGINQDYKQAIQWYRKAAEQGLPHAQVSVGWYYMAGLGNLIVDYKKAAYWNELGAKNGNPEGFNNLGWLYEHGLGVKQDFSKAAELYQNAITKGVEKRVDQERIEEARSRLTKIKR